LTQSVTLVDDKKNGLIHIEYTDENPKFAAAMANAYVEALGAVLEATAIHEARGRREALERQLTEATNKSYKNIVIRDAIIQSLVQQAETARLSESSSYLAFSQVDRAEPPILRSSPKRTQTAVYSALTALALLLVYIFIRHSFTVARSRSDYSVKTNRIRSGLGL
jgi:uncharacterized protein involved in exopolysaccharide biosynthesis